MEEELKIEDQQPIFVSGNKGKLREVNAFLEGCFEKPLEAIDIDLPELQGEPHYIAREKCLMAVAQAKRPCFVEDTSLCFNALKGLPGPYIKWFLKKLGHDGLNKMLVGFEDKTAYAQCVFAYTDGVGKEVHIFDGRCPGIIRPARGDNQFGWDPIFQPADHINPKKLTFAEMSKEEKNIISHRGNALAKLKEFLQKR